MFGATWPGEILGAGIISEAGIGVWAQNMGAKKLLFSIAAFGGVLGSLLLTVLVANRFQHKLQ